MNGTPPTGNSAPSGDLKKSFAWDVIRTWVEQSGQAWRGNHKDLNHRKEGMKIKRKKLNLKVKTRFQIWLLFRVFGSVLLSSIVAGIILYYYSHQEIGENFFNAHLEIRRVSDLLIPVLIAGSFASLVTGSLLALFIPQKIAGPIFRMEEDLKEIQAGNLKKRIRLRKEDPLQELAATINTTIAFLLDKINGSSDRTLS
jgi:methyl-accepting chemotaxis protein